MIPLVVALLLVLALALIVARLGRRLWNLGWRGRAGIAAIGCLLIGVASALYVADSRSRASNARVEAQRSALDAHLRTALAAGDRPEKIEGVLSKTGIKFARERGVLSGYYASIGTEQPDSWIQIVVSLDRDDRLKDITVQWCYTSS